MEKIKVFEMGIKADLEMQQADVYVGKTIYQAVIRKLLSSCCNCCFKKKPTEQPDPRLNWTIIDVEARFVLLYYYITFPHLIGCSSFALVTFAPT